MESSAIIRSSDATQRSTAAGSSTQYLTFALGNELFAMPIERVREVVEFQGLTRVPLAPACVPGVLNLRGAVVPVVDLSVRFGREPTSIGRRTCVVVVETRTDDGLTTIGVIVDAVSEALEVDRQQVEHAPAFGTGLRSEFVSAMLNLQQRFVVVLELDVVLSMRELEELVSAAVGARDAGTALARA